MRLEILKTYKLYINGQFPRTESGRYYTAMNTKGEQLANVCLASRKDFRDSMVAARTAFGGWSSRAAFNRGQILYRIAEMLEDRKLQFMDELMRQGASRTAAIKEVETCIERLVYYSGWCDKYQQIFSSVNPVAGNYFNFSTTEPTGVVAVIAPQSTALLGLVSVIAPVVAGGNTCVVLASETKPLSAITFGEVLATSDLPNGVVNILTGKIAELQSWMAGHMDVNAILYADGDFAIEKSIREKAADNMKRFRSYPQLDWMSKEGESPYLIMDFQEIKTTWHPVENIGGSKSGY